MISGREWLATGKHISLLKRAGNGTGFSLSFVNGAFFYLFVSAMGQVFLYRFVNGVVDMERYIYQDRL